MSKIYVSETGSCRSTEVTTPEELFSRRFEPYSWVFYVKGANRYVGACFCSTPLKKCPVLQYALKDKNLSADLYIDSRVKSKALYGDADSNGWLMFFVFTFIPTVNPSGLQQKLSSICDKCTAIQIPWVNTKQQNNVISAMVKESAQHEK